MKRHSFDPSSFVFGVAFIAVAVGLSAEIFDLGPQMLRWLGAGVLLLLGTLLLVTSRSRDADRR